MFHTAIPPKNYFFVLYITLYIISPYINLAINNLQNKALDSLILLLLIVFSIYPTVMDSYQHLVGNNVMGCSTVGAWGQQHGYTIVNFALCYIIGAYIRMSSINEQIPTKVLLALVPLLTIGIFTWLVLEQKYLGSSFSLSESNSLSYSNPFVILLSAALLMIFSRIKYSSKAVNSFSKSVFACYLIGLFVLPRMGIESVAEYSLIGVIIHLFITIITVSLFSFLLWKLIDFLIFPLSRKLAKYEIIKVVD